MICLYFVITGDGLGSGLPVGEGYIVSTQVLHLRLGFDSEDDSDQRLRVTSLKFRDCHGAMVVVHGWVRKTQSSRKRKIPQIPTKMILVERDALLFRIVELLANRDLAGLRSRARTGESLHMSDRIYYTQEACPKL